MKRQVILTGIGIFLFSCSIPVKDNQISDQKMINELTESLNKGILDIWYPRTIDSTSGGFLSGFDYKWEMKGPQNKMIVTQSRHVWTCSTVAGFYPEKKEQYLKIARHGFQFKNSSSKGFRLLFLVDRNQFLKPVRVLNPDSFITIPSKIQTNYLIGILYICLKLKAMRAVDFKTKIDILSTIRESCSNCFSLR